MTEPAPPRPEIRDAATAILVRGDGLEPRVLMGQRGAEAAFMASKFVFPGGALDPADITLAASYPADPETEVLLAAWPRDGAPVPAGAALVLAAIRETWEETGLAIADPLGGPAPATGEPSWDSFFAAGLTPAVRRLRLVFRAITPPGRPRRFDARFFLVPADAVATALEDFSRTEDELSHLSWLTLPEARALDLPFVTGVVLAELAAILADAGARHPVPFFRHDGGRSFLHAL